MDRCPGSVMADSPPLKELELVLGHSFSDRLLLERAVSHSSWAQDQAGGPQRQDNERLEFLGDAVLDLVISEKLYLTSSSTEGRLTRARAMLVRKETLAKHARQLGLGSYLRLGRGEMSSGGADKDSILADALESVIAAIYLDGGLAPAANFVGSLFGDDLSRRSQDGDLHAPRDPRTELQEALQAAGRGTPSYRLKSLSGPDHMPTWIMEVLAAGEALAEGQGSSKQEASRRAASAALQELGKGP